MSDTTASKATQPWPSRPAGLGGPTGVASLGGAGQELGQLQRRQRVAQLTGIPLHTLCSRLHLQSKARTEARLRSAGRAAHSYRPHLRAAATAAAVYAAEAAAKLDARAGPSEGDGSGEVSAGPDAGRCVRGGGGPQQELDAALTAAFLKLETEVLGFLLSTERISALGAAKLFMADSHSRCTALAAAGAGEAPNPLEWMNYMHALGRTRAALRREGSLLDAAAQSALMHDTYGMAAALAAGSGGGGGRGDGDGGSRGSGGGGSSSSGRGSGGTGGGGGGGFRGDGAGGTGVEGSTRSLVAAPSLVLLSVLMQCWMQRRIVRDTAAELAEVAEAARTALGGLGAGLFSAVASIFSGGGWVSDSSLTGTDAEAHTFRTMDEALLQRAVVLAAALVQGNDGGDQHACGVLTYPELLLLAALLDASQEAVSGITPLDVDVDVPHPPAPFLSYTAPPHTPAALAILLRIARATAGVPDVTALDPTDQRLIMNVVGKGHAMALKAATAAATAAVLAPAARMAPGVRQNARHDPRTAYVAAYRAEFSRYRLRVEMFRLEERERKRDKERRQQGGRLGSDGSGGDGEGDAVMRAARRKEAHTERMACLVLAALPDVAMQHRAAAGRGGGGGGAGPALSSRELGQLAPRVALARALLTADQGGEAVAVAAAGGGAMLLALAATAALNEMRARAHRTMDQACGWLRQQQQQQAGEEMVGTVGLPVGLGARPVFVMEVACSKGLRERHGCAVTETAANGARQQQQRFEAVSLTPRQCPSPASWLSERLAEAKGSVAEAESGVGGGVLPLSSMRLQQSPELLRLERRRVARCLVEQRAAVVVPSDEVGLEAAMGMLAELRSELLPLGRDLRVLPQLPGLAQDPALQAAAQRLSADVWHMLVAAPHQSCRVNAYVRGGAVACASDGGSSSQAAGAGAGWELGVRLAVNRAVCDLLGLCVGSGDYGDGCSGDGEGAEASSGGGGAQVSDGGNGVNGGGEQQRRMRLPMDRVRRLPLRLLVLEVEVESGDGGRLCG